MVARLEKVDAVSTYDGFDPKTFYQMVPVDGARGGFKATTDADEVVLSLEPRNVVRFGNRSFSPPTPFPIEDYVMRMQPHAIVNFELFGEKASNATLVLRDRSGKALQGLLVSAKTQIRKTYSLNVLTDMVRSTSPWERPVLRPMMDGVEKVFLQQANIKLIQLGNVLDVNINDEDLGNPLVLDRLVIDPNDPNSTLKLGTHIAFHRKIPIALRINADFRIFFTWDIRTIEFGDVVGASASKLAFVEFNDLTLYENAHTTAHELGHLLGLAFHTTSQFLMAGDGSSRTSRLQQFEIDTINKTDGG